MWISLGLTYLRLAQLLESVGLQRFFVMGEGVFLAKLESFQALFQVLFSPAFFLLSFQDTNNMNARSFVIVLPSYGLMRKEV